MNEPNDEQLEAIVHTYNALMACNSHEPWAPQRDNKPYGAVHNALVIMIKDVWGEELGERIIYQMHDTMPHNASAWLNMIECIETR